MTELNDLLLPQIAKGVKAGIISAIEQARKSGTKLVIFRDEEIIEITADEAEEMLLKEKKQ